MRRLSVLYTTIFLSWFFASLPAPAQTTMTRKAPSYAFEVGKEYVYTYSFKQVDKTALEHHHGDSFLETRTISICTVAVDSLGEMLLVFTMTDENIEPVGDLDANGLEQGIRGGWENKFRALVSPVGHVRNGEILEPSESTRAFIEEAKNVKPGQYVWRLPDSIAVKDFTTLLLPELPPFCSRTAGDVEVVPPSGAFVQWKNERDWKVESAVTDTVDFNDERAMRIDTRAEHAKETVFKEHLPNFSPTEYRDFGQRIILRANGCLESWVGRTTMYFMSRPGPKVFMFEQSITLIEIRPCRQSD